jgi:hypothetical protein
MMWSLIYLGSRRGAKSPYNLGLSDQNWDENEQIPPISAMMGAQEEHKNNAGRSSN